MDNFSKFRCLLDDQPDHLTPDRHLRTDWGADLTGHPLFLNKNCWLTGPEQLPCEMDPRRWSKECFAPLDNTLWIRDPLTGALQPFWLGPRMLDTLSRMQRTERIADLSPHCARTLATAGILVPDPDASPQAKLHETLSRSAPQARQYGYAPVSGLIHPFHISALRRYYRCMLRNGAFQFGDRQSSRRYFAHNEGVARFFHFQLTAAVSLVFGVPVKPSYVYFASYQEGAVLEKHVDRSQCEFSISLCLDYSPEPRCETPWPLHLHAPQGLTSVYQSIGDALFYRGCRIPHSRDVLPTGHTSTSIFFHYVAEDFEGSLN